MELSLPSLQTEEPYEHLLKHLLTGLWSYLLLRNIWDGDVNANLVTATALTATRPAGSRMGLLYFLALAGEPPWTIAGLDPSRV